MKNLKLLLSTALIAALMFTGCAAKEEEKEIPAEEATIETGVDQTSDEADMETIVEATAGHMDGNTFVNEYLGFSVDIPKSWDIQGKEMLDKMNEIGSDIASSGDEELKDSMEEAINNNMLFQVSAFKYALDSGEVQNPNITLIGEKIEIGGVLYSTEDYIKNMQMMLSNIDMVTSALLLEDTIIDGATFKTMEVVMEANDMKVTQVYYVTSSKDYALTIALAYYDEDSKAELMKTLDTIKMSK